MPALFVIMASVVLYWLAYRLVRNVLLAILIVLFILAAEGVP